MPSFRRTKTARSRAGCWVQISEKFKMKVENTTKIPNLQPGRKAGPSSGANFSLRKNRAVSKSRKKRAPHARVRSWQVRPQGWPLPFARKRRVRLLADYFSNFEAKFYKFSTNVLRFVLRNAFAISLSLKKITETVRNSETILVKVDEMLYEVLLAVVKFDEIRLNIENKNETMQNVLKIRRRKKLE